MNQRAARSDDDLWKVIQSYKVAIAAFVLLSLGLMGHLAPLAQLAPDPSTPVGGILKSLSDALITTALVGLVWEWWVRNEGARGLRTELVRASLIERDILKRFDSDFLLAAVKTCLEQVCRGDRRISESIHAVVSRHAQTHANVRRNYSYEGHLRKPTGRIATLSTECYSYTAVISYETVLTTDELIIGYSNSRAGLDAVPTDDRLIVRWRCHEIQGLSLGSDEIFSVLGAEIGGHQATPIKVVHDKYVSYSLKVPEMKSMVGSWVRFSFVIHSIMRADEHYISNSVGYPTESFRMSISWTDALGVIPTVKAIEHFCSDQKPQVSWVPPNTSEPHTVVVSVDGWILPSSGVVFVW